MTTWTVGSLFSGIGGIEHGLERTGRFETKWFIENNQFCQKVLKQHWQEATIYGDITAIDFTQLPKVDILTGGFPCQDISIAGKKAGIKEGTRSGLWFYFAKAIGILRPKFVIIENVSELANRGLNIVLADLAQAGYDAEWIDLRASDFGALHKRERIFIIAFNTDSIGCDKWESDRQERSVLQTPIGKVAKNKSEWDGWECRNDTGTSINSSNSNRERHGGRSNEETQWSQNDAKIQRRNISSFFTNTFGYRQFQATNGRVTPSFEKFQGITNPEQLFGNPEIPEPIVHGKRNGIPNHLDRIKGCGNAVVPDCAQFIGELLIERFGDRI